MSVAKHLVLLAKGLAVWAVFWIAGLPAYYQQYSPVAMASGCIFLSVAVSLAARLILSRVRPETRLRRAVWISCYFTVPFAILDWLYCGVYLEHGPAFLVRYWYVTVFYFTPWLTFIPTAIVLGRMQAYRA